MVSISQKRPICCAPDSSFDCSGVKEKLPVCCAPDSSFDCRGVRSLPLISISCTSLRDSRLMDATVWQAALKSSKHSTAQATCGGGDEGGGEQQVGKLPRSYPNTAQHSAGQMPLGSKNGGCSGVDKGNV